MDYQNIVKLAAEGVFWAVLTLVPLILSVAYLIYFERKVMAAMQLRQGPDAVGFFGLLQPVADGVKLLSKQIIIPYKVDTFLFLLAPMITFVLALAAWAVIPIGAWGAAANVNLGVLYILAISSLAVYGIVIAGWASNSVYSFLGALRSAAQMISYEVSMSLIVICVVMIAGSMNLTEIVEAQRDLWFAVPLFPFLILFFISVLAETNRHPFDLPEAESELVAGYQVEYSGFMFALFFLGEYANMIMMSFLTSILFLGGWYPPLSLPPFTWIPGFLWLILKVVGILFLFVWVRVALPRYRYDQLMTLGWQVFLPLSLIGFVLVAFVVYFLL